MEGDFEITLDGEHVWFIDPLFLTPGMKGYDLDDLEHKNMTPVWNLKLAINHLAT